MTGHRHDEHEALPRVLEQIETPHGELVLRQVGDAFEVISDGQFLMDTRNGESERLLITAALDGASDGKSLLIGGLGVGFSLEAALLTNIRSVTVVEVQSDIIRWAGTYFSHRMTALLADPRLTVENAELLDWMLQTDASYDAICLDVDNGPEWLSRIGNAGLYTDQGLALIAKRLEPHGSLSIWSAHRSCELEQALQQRFMRVQYHTVSVPRGEPDVVYVAQDPRPSNEQ